jgi:hypothetical protein
MVKKNILKKAEKLVKRLGKDLNKSPIGRASQGKHTKGYF